jgi:hypothetical protein
MSKKHDADAVVDLQEPDVESLAVRAPAITQITCAEDAQTVSDYLGEVREVRKRIKDFFAPLKANAHKAWKAICERENEIDAEPAKLENRCKGLIGDWHRREQERVAAEQRRLDELARQKALREAKKAEDAKLVKAIETGKLTVAAPVTPRAPEKVAGVTFRRAWKARIVDPKPLLKAAASGKIPVGYVLNKERDGSWSVPKALADTAQSSQGELIVPGVVISEITRVAGR